MKDILFLMVDQLSAKWLELGLEICELPNLKRMKESAMYFECAYTNNPVCCPARATIATGLSSRSHGVIENGYYLNADAPTFMKTLQEKGYYTGAFGKLHFVPHFSGFNCDYQEYGFDETHITEDSRAGEWYDWAVRNFPEYKRQILRSIPTPKIEALKNYGTDKENLQEQIIKLQEEPWNSEKYPQATAWAHCLEFPKEASQTAWITKTAIESIRKIPKEKPVFAHISYVQPHNPYEVPEEYLEKVDVDKIPERLPATWNHSMKEPPYFWDKKPEDREEWKFERQVYLASLVYLDEAIGQIIEEWKKIRGMDNTYVFFVSDHGDMLGDHGFYLKEEKHYDSCIRIPLMISGPGIEQGSVCSNIVQLEDICPTIMDMADTHMPYPPYAEVFMQVDAEKLPIYHGNSLLPLAMGKEIHNWRNAGYCESYNPVFSMKQTDWARTLITHQYRYTYYFRGGEQLFDLIKDRDELINVADEAEYETIKRELKAQLLEKIIEQDWPKPVNQLYCLGVH